MNKKHYFKSFVIPTIIFIMVFFIIKIDFIGKKDFVISDATGQYVSLFSYLKDWLTGQVSLFYSFEKGMGGNMLGTFAYYLASPLNLLIIFFSKKNLINGMLLIITLKIGLSGLTMFSFLKRKHNKGNSLLIFSTSYALMGYIVVYFFNLMWLDALYLTPLIMIGIDKIIEGRSSLIYDVFLFIAIFSNYYTGYMICIFSCFYFLYQMLLKLNFKENRDLYIGVIIRFSIASLLAGLMTSMLLLPTFYELIINVGRGIDINHVKSIFNGDFLKLFSRFYLWSHNETNILNFTTVAIYSGVITLPLVYFYFVNSKIKLKERIITGIFLIIILLGLFIAPIDLFWHGLSYHNSFDYRYSFLITIFLIMIASKSFYKVKEIKIKHYLYFLSGYLLLSNLVILQKYEFLTLWSVYVSVGLTILYLLLLYTYTSASCKEKRLLKILLITLVISELFFNFYLSIRGNQFKYKMEYRDWVTIFGSEIKEISSSKNEFYRVEKDMKYSSIDSMLLNYNGVSTFISTLNSKSRQLFDNVGHYSLMSRVGYNLDSSMITDSLFGIKYIITSAKDIDYNKVSDFQFSGFSGILFNEQKTDVYIYENPYALSLGFMVNNNVKDFINVFSQGKITNVFEVQNYMLNSMVNNNDLYFKPYEVFKIDDNNFKSYIDNDKDIYIIVPVNLDYNDGNFNIHINNKLINYYNYSKKGIFKIENNYQNTDIKLTINFAKKGTYYPSIYYFDEELFFETIDELKKNQLDIIIRDKNYIKGSINVTKDKDVLFTTIPYEKGWTITVDGKKTDYYSVYDAFIGLDLNVGEHIVEFRYEPPLFRIGTIITGISTLIFIIYMIFERQFINAIVKTYNRYEEIINYLIAGGLTTVVSIGTYGIFAKVFNINYLLSTVISFIFAVVFAYFINKVFVFKTKFLDKNIIFKEAYQFIKYRIISLVIDVILMIMLVELLQINDLLAKIIVQVIIVVANYFFSKLFIFKKEVGEGI